MFGHALAYKRGEVKDAPDEVKRIADTMDEETIGHFANTPTEGLPERVKAAGGPLGLVKPLLGVGADSASVAVGNAGGNVAEQSINTANSTLSGVDALQTAAQAAGKPLVATAESGGKAAPLLAEAGMAGKAVGGLLKAAPIAAAGALAYETGVVASDPEKAREETQEALHGKNVAQRAAYGAMNPAHAIAEGGRQVGDAANAFGDLQKANEQAGTTTTNLSGGGTATTDPIAKNPMLNSAAATTASAPSPSSGPSLSISGTPAATGPTNAPNLPNVPNPQAPGPSSTTSTPQPMDKQSALRHGRLLTQLVIDDLHEKQTHPEGESGEGGELEGEGHKAAPASGVPLTGPEAIAHALGKLDLQKVDAEARAVITGRKVSKRPRAVQVLNVLEGLKRNNLKPTDLMIRSVPVIPPAFRPFSVVGNTFVPGDANELYRDLIHLRDGYTDARGVLGDEGTQDTRLALYDAVKALYGYGEPTSPKTKQRGVAGFLKQVSGTSPKWCYDDETEILTRKYGWVFFRDLPEDTEVATINPKTLAFEWQTPDAYFHDEYNGQMVHVRVGKHKNLRMDLLVTPEHQQWYKTRRGRKNGNMNPMTGWEKEDATKLIYGGNRRYFMAAAPAWEQGEMTKPAFCSAWSDDDFAAFLGWWIAEGDLHTDGCAVNIWQSMINPDYCAEIEQLFERIRSYGCSVSRYTKTAKDTGLKCYGYAVIDARPLVDWIRENCGSGSQNKRIARPILDWPKPQLEILLHAFLKGDGDKRKTIAKGHIPGGSCHKNINLRFHSHNGFSTTSPQLFQDMHELTFKVGLALRRQTEHPECHPATRLEIFNGGLTHQWFAQMESSGSAAFEEYQGAIHCCSTANGLLIVRRHGAVVVSGNSFFQRKMISKPMDSVSRGTITVDPDLSLDEVGVPEDMAWTMYKPYIQRRLTVSMGMSPTDSLTHVTDRTEHARKALLKEMEERPVIYTRAPSWHKFNVLAGRPKLIEGSTIAINPLVTTGQNADFDGDAMNLHVPSHPDAVKEAYEKLMPSKMLWSIRDQDKVVPQPKQEQVLGLFSAVVRPAKSAYTFNSEAQAVDAIRRGQIRLSDEVNIKGAE